MLKGKVVLITGAAGRIGSACARAVVGTGGKVALADIADKALSQLADSLGKGNALPIHADVTDPLEVDRVILEACANLGGINAAVHSAYPRSAGWGTRFEDLSRKQLSQDLDQQLGGAILFSQKILKLFKESGGGNLVHVASIQGIAAPKFEHYAGTTMGSPIEYSAMKAGIISATRYLARYYRNHNIRVNCISPGGILDNQPESFLRSYRASCNSKGMLDAQDLAGVFTFLLSDQSKYMTGQNLVIDDGWSL